MIDILGDLFDLLQQDEHKLPYILTGTVLNNYHPLKPASVQVTLPQRTQGLNITAWARVVMPFVNSDGGAYSLPAIGDEVALAFCNGELDSPIVIGSLYTMEQMPPAAAVSPLNTVKCVKTKLGNAITLDDTPGKNGIEIKTPLGQRVRLTDTPPAVTVQDSTGNTCMKLDGATGEVTISALKNLRLTAGGCSVALDGAGQSVTISAPSITLDASQSLTLKGAQLNVKGQLVSVEGAQQLELKSTGSTTVKGGIVNIN